MTNGSIWLTAHQVLVSSAQAKFSLHLLATAATINVASFSIAERARLMSSSVLRIPSATGRLIKGLPSKRSFQQPCLLRWPFLSWCLLLLVISNTAGTIGFNLDANTHFSSYFLKGPGPCKYGQSQLYKLLNGYEVADSLIGGNSYRGSSSAFSDASVKSDNLIWWRCFYDNLSTRPSFIKAIETILAKAAKVSIIGTFLELQSPEKRSVGCPSNFHSPTPLFDLAKRTVASLTAGSCCAA